ncbi:MAG: hypothetical protein EOO25_07220 [Comamonadaceae bacterium]|nr:MAG: hypothetical protein EOO25_07220 [Comamonadaceae bacterium]
MKFLSGSVLALIAVAGSIALPAAAQPRGPDSGYDGGHDINLVCYGEGAKPAAESKYGYQWDDRDRKYRLREHTELESRQFDASVTVQLSDDHGRVRLSGPLIPLLNNGGAGGGWWELDNVRIGRDEIRATYALNGLNKPRLFIDRHSGRITIDGIETFRGSCDSVDQRGGRRF